MTSNLLTAVLCAGLLRAALFGVLRLLPVQPLLAVPGLRRLAQLTQGILLQRSDGRQQTAGSRQQAVVGGQQTDNK